MPSRIRRNTWTRRLSPSPCVSTPARSHSRPAASRRGRGTAWPSRRRSTSAISAGRLSDSGRRDQAKRPLSRWRPAAARTRGAPSLSKTGAGEPSSRTSWGQASELPGNRTSTARSARRSSANVPPEAPSSSCSRPGQRQTACPCTVAQPSVGTWSSTHGTHARREGGRSSLERGWAHGRGTRPASAMASVSPFTTSSSRRRTGTSLRGPDAVGPLQLPRKDTAYSREAAGEGRSSEYSANARASPV